MRRVSPVVMLLMLLVLLAVSTAVLAAAPLGPNTLASQGPGPQDDGKSMFIGNLYARIGASGLVTFKATNGGKVNPNPEAMPENWGLSEVRVSPDGKVWVINGAAALMESVGIRTSSDNGATWTENSYSCGDASIPVYNGAVYYNTCDTWPGNWIYRVPLSGTPREPLYQTGDGISSIDVNPVNGNIAVAEYRYLQLAGWETPEDYQDDIWIFQHRLILLDNNGGMILPLVWVNGWPYLTSLRWTKDGSQLMYAKEWDEGPPDYDRGLALYRTNLSGICDYGDKVEDDVNCYTTIEDGYAFSHFTCPPRCYPDFDKRGDATSTVTMVRADGTESSFTLKGRLAQLDVYQSK